MRFIPGYAFTVKAAAKTRGHFYAVRVETVLSLSRTLVVIDADVQRTYPMITRIRSLSAVYAAREVLFLTGRDLLGSTIPH